MNAFRVPANNQSRRVYKAKSHYSKLNYQFSSHQLSELFERPKCFTSTFERSKHFTMRRRIINKIVHIISVMTSHTNSKWAAQLSLVDSNKFSGSWFQKKRTISFLKFLCTRKFWKTACWNLCYLLFNSFVYFLSFFPGCYWCHGKD